MRDNLIKRSWFTLCRRLFNGCNVAKTLYTTGHLTFLKTSQLAGCWWTGVSRQQDINSVQGDRLQTMSKSVCTVKISKLIHFQSKNNMKWRYVLAVVITSHILITNEIHNWLNHVFILSPLAEPTDNESETDVHLTRMGPRVIMNICLIFSGPVFCYCWNQFSSGIPLWRKTVLHIGDTCSYCLSNVRAGTCSCHSRH